MSEQPRPRFRWLATCTVSAMLAGLLYLGVAQLILLPDAINRGQNHKIGSGTNSQEWWYALSDFVLDFPFGWTVLNSLVWAAVGCALAAYLTWRRRNAI